MEILCATFSLWRLILRLAYDACSDMSCPESSGGDENRTATFGELGDLMKEFKRRKSVSSKKNRRTTASPGALENLLREITQDTDNENTVCCNETNLWCNMLTPTHIIIIPMQDTSVDMSTPKSTPVLASPEATPMLKSCMSGKKKSKRARVQFCSPTAAEFNRDSPVRRGLMYIFLIFVMHTILFVGAFRAKEGLLMRLPHMCVH